MELPIQDAEHVREVKERLRALYGAAPLNRIPFEIEEGAPDTKTAHADEAKGTREGARSVHDNAFHFESQLEQMRKILDRPYRDDRILALYPTCWVGTIASAFGCATKFLDYALPWTQHVMEDPADIDNLVPDIAKADLFHLALEKLHYFQDRVGDLIPIGLPDIQAPLDTASIVMKDTALLLAMHTDPGRIHRLLDMITDVIIEMVRRFSREVANPFSLSHARWLPRGIHMSDDYLAVISPAMYEEFGVPYNERIGKEFGGLFLHSCGDYTRTGKALLKIESLMGIDFHEFPMNAMAKETDSGLVFASGFVEEAYLTHQARSRHSPDELIKKSWTDLEALREVRNPRVLFTATCIEKERGTEYYERLLGISQNVAQRIPLP